MNDENDIDNKNEQMAAALERTGRFRVLRKLQPRASRTEPLGATRRALFIDLETTGLDARADEVIEIGLLPFVFTDAGDIVDVLPAFDRLRQPTKPIPPKISDLTGITNEMVAGRTIDLDEIAAIVAPAELIIAHNARFDRTFAERLHPIFATKPWGCSMTQALWTEHGFEGSRLRRPCCRDGFVGAALRTKALMAAERERADVREARAAPGSSGARRARGSRPHRLVIVDETAVTTKRARPRCHSRRGERHTRRGAEDQNPSGRGWHRPSPRPDADGWLDA